MIYMVILAIGLITPARGDGLFVARDQPGSGRSDRQGGRHLRLGMLWLRWLIVDLPMDGDLDPQPDQHLRKAGRWHGFLGWSAVLGKVAEAVLVFSFTSMGWRS